MIWIVGISCLFTGVIVGVLATSLVTVAGRATKAQIRR